MQHEILVQRYFEDTGRHSSIGLLTADEGCKYTRNLLLM